LLSLDNLAALCIYHDYDIMLGSVSICK